MKTVSGRCCARLFKLLLFFLFLGASAVLLTLGLRLWLETGGTDAQAEETFTTIGMVRQKENLMEAVPSWDAGTKSYTYFDHPVYEEILPESILDFDDADYLAGPEKRPVYGFLDARILLWPGREYGYAGDFYSRDFSCGDCVPSQPVKVDIRRVLYG